MQETETEGGGGGGSQTEKKKKEWTRMNRALVFHYKTISSGLNIETRKNMHFAHFPLHFMRPEVLWYKTKTLQWKEMINK